MISVIIPCLNEEDNLARLLGQLIEQKNISLEMMNRMKTNAKFNSTLNDIRDRTTIQYMNERSYDISYWRPECDILSAVVEPVSKKCITVVPHHV